MSLVSSVVCSLCCSHVLRFFASSPFSIVSYWYCFVRACSFWQTKVVCRSRCGTLTPCFLAGIPFVCYFLCLLLLWTLKSVFCKATAPAAVSNARLSIHDGRGAFCGGGKEATLTGGGRRLLYDEKVTLPVYYQEGYIHDVSKRGKD